MIVARGVPNVKTADVPVSIVKGMGGERVLAFVNVSGLDKAEDAAKQILEHIQAIKLLMADLTPGGIRVNIDFKSEMEADSGN